jgi:hypothetical protein
MFIGADVDLLPPDELFVTVERFVLEPRRTPTTLLFELAAADARDICSQ